MNKVQFLITSDVDNQVKNSIIEMLNSQEILKDFEIIEDFELPSSNDKLRAMQKDFTPIIIGHPQLNIVECGLGHTLGANRLHEMIFIPPIEEKALDFIHIKEKEIEHSSIVEQLIPSDIINKIALVGAVNINYTSDMLGTEYPFRNYLGDSCHLNFGNNLNGKANKDRQMHLSDQIYGGKISHNMSRWENKLSQKTMILKRRKK
jgi:hypothetical protein